MRMCRRGEFYWGEGYFFWLLGDHDGTDGIGNGAFGYLLAWDGAWEHEQEAQHRLDDDDRHDETDRYSIHRLQPLGKNITATSTLH